MMVESFSQIRYLMACVSLQTHTQLAEEFGAIASSPSPSSLTKSNNAAASNSMGTGTTSAQQQQPQPQGRQQPSSSSMDSKNPLNAMLSGAPRGRSIEPRAHSL
jgi:hypothetical protein